MVWPCRTNAPTLTGVETTCPDVCGATFEVSSAIRLPVACIYDGTSRATAVAVVTATGGASGCAPAPAAPRPPPPFAASPAASAFDSDRPHDAKIGRASCKERASTPHVPLALE